jgi:hypothetical protein
MEGIKTGDSIDRIGRQIDGGSIEQEIGNSICEIRIFLRAV